MYMHYSTFRPMLRLTLGRVLRARDFHQQTQGFVHGLRVWERGRHVRLQKDEVRALSVALGVFAARPPLQLRKVVLGAQFVVFSLTLSFLHGTFSPCASARAR